MPAFEDEYMDVLQNIEMAIVSVYRDHDDLLDYDVDKVLNLLWKEYRSEQINKKTPMPILNERTQLVYERVKEMCEWRLGRSEITVDDRFVKVRPEPISMDEILDCLKRIRKSVS